MNQKPILFQHFKRQNEMVEFANRTFKNKQQLVHCIGPPVFDLFTQLFISLLLFLFPYIEDLTQVVISYEICETRLRRVSIISYEMPTSVRFCLSYDPLKQDFIAFRMMGILIRKCIVDMDVVNDITYTHQSAITRVVI